MDTVAVSSLKTSLEWAKYIFNMVVNFLSKYRNILLIYSFDMKFSPDVSNKHLVHTSKEIKPCVMNMMQPNQK